MNTPRVILFQVRDAAAKLRSLAQAVQHHFTQREKIILFAEDDKALHFADELLWKMPLEGFLPHAIAESPCEAWIALTKTKLNFNNASVAFNLCPTPLLVEGGVKVIYDFDDAGSPNRKMLSQIRFEAYKAAHYPIESREGS